MGRYILGTWHESTEEYNKARAESLRKVEKSLQERNHALHRNGGKMSNKETARDKAVEGYALAYEVSKSDNAFTEFGQNCFDAGYAAMEKQTQVKHEFWGAGDPDCPKDIKAPNGELHTLRCKNCDNPRSPWCSNGYAAAQGQQWVPVSARLPPMSHPVDVTVCEIHDAYDPPEADYWIERELEFRGDHWLLRDDGHDRQNVRYALSEIVAWREMQEPYKPEAEK